MQQRSLEEIIRYRTIFVFVVNLIFNMLFLLTFNYFINIVFYKTTFYLQINF